MNAPRVSVVTIFLNAEAYLREAIESVLAQDFAEFELILVDDGSSDASSTIAQDYACRSPHQCFYVEHPDHSNKGMSASRNLGISVARGNYVAFLDADDVWTPTKLREQVQILDSHPEVGMVAGAAQYWRSWQSGIDEVVRAGHRLDCVVPPRSASIHVYPLGKAQAPCPSVLMLRRDLIERVGGFEASYTGALQMYEDQAFLSKVYLETHVWFSSRCWLRYRQHPESCVAENIRLGNYDRIRRHFLEWFQNYLVERGVTDPAISGALAHTLGPDQQTLLAAMRSSAGLTIRRLRRIPGRLLRG